MSKLYSDEKIEVNADAFIELMQAFKGPGYLIREIQAIADFPNTPLFQLFDDLQRYDERQHD